MVLLARASETRVAQQCSWRSIDRPGASLTELARAVRVTSPTASEHLDVLEEAGLVRRDRNGRGLAVHLAGEHAARLVEQLLAFDPPSELPEAPRKSRGCGVGGRVTTTLLDVSASRSPIAS